MGKAKKPAFQPPWRFVVPVGSRPDHKDLFDGLTEAWRRAQLLKKSPKFERLLAVIRRIEQERHEAGEEFYEAQVDLSHRSMLSELVETARRAGDPACRLVSPFLAAHFLIAVRPDDPRRHQKFLRVLRTGVLYSRMAKDESAARNKMVRSAREVLEKLRLEPDRIKKMVWFLSDDVTGTSEAMGIMLSRGDTDLLSLLDPGIDEELVDAALDGKMEDGPLGPGEIDAASDYCRAVAASKRRLLERVQRYSDKMLHALKYVTDPIELIGEQRHDCPSFLYLMATGLRMTMNRYAGDMTLPLMVAQVTGEATGPKAAWSELLEIKGVLMMFAEAPETWYVVLHQILASTGGILGDRFSDWAIPLLCDLVQHPAKLNRRKAPAKAAKAKSLLARYVAPCLVGFHPSLEESALCSVARLREMEPRHALFLFCEHIAAAPADDWDEDRPDGAFVFRDERKRKAMARTVASFIGGNFEAVLTRYCADRGGAEEDVPDVFDLLPDLDVDEPEEELVRRPEREPITCSYVQSPAIPEQRTRMVLSPDDQAKVLDRFFRKNKIPAIIKTESIAGALAYFLDMPATARQLAPKETVAGRSWTKLKRGRLRILTHETEEGELLFHIYPRKTWKTDMFAATQA